MSYWKTRYHAWKSQGLCVECGLPQFEGRVYCKRHWEYHRNYDKTRCRESREKRNAHHLRWHHKTKSQRLPEIRGHRLRIKQEVMNHYGGKCRCCGESLLVFLDIDHINNDGARHRKETGRAGYSLYLWLRNSNYPPGFQVLCKNCNWAKHVLGQCPHECVHARKSCSD